MALPISRNFPSGPTPIEDIHSPKSTGQWKAVLQKVKLLYLKRQYKQCAGRSNELLKDAKGPLHPVYKTYLYFYIAISYEALGRAAHNYSKNKLPFLHLALDNFTACSLSVPSMIPVPRVEDSSASDDENYPSSSSDISAIESVWSGVTLIRDETPIESPVPPDDDPFVSRQDAVIKDLKPLTFKLPAKDIRRSELIPAPLRIRKRSPDPTSESDLMFDTESLGNPSLHAIPAKVRPLPPLPIKVMPARRTFPVSLVSGNSTRPTSEQKETVSITPTRARAISRYNNHIRSFSSQLSTTIAEVSSLVATITELQHIHRATKLRRAASFWSFTPIGVKSKSPGQAHSLDETKQQRISRLRAEGWDTVGLKSKHRGWKGREYYSNLCSDVLDELYQLQ